MIRASVDYVVRAPNESRRVLVVDDASDMRLALTLRLQREGYAVTAAASGREAIEIVEREGLPHVAILDVLMPDMDGFQLAQELQSLGEVSIIFLSALSDVDTKVEGLTRYAEDFITKPFAFSELLARVRRVLLRADVDPTGEPEHSIDPALRVNFSQQYAVVNNHQIMLTPTENRIMHILYRHRGRVLSPGFLLAKAWDPMRGGSVESLWVHIRRLRSKIEPDPENPKYVVTVRGQGYCLPQSESIHQGNGLN